MTIYGNLSWKLAVPFAKETLETLQISVKILKVDCVFWISFWLTIGAQIRDVLGWVKLKTLKNHFSDEFKVPMNLLKPCLKILMLSRLSFVKKLKNGKSDFMLAQIFVEAFFCTINLRSIYSAKNHKFHSLRKRNMTDVAMTKMEVYFHIDFLFF